MQSFTHTHEGQTYTIGVRLCPDGFTDGATRAAVTNAFATLVNFRDIHGNEANTNALFDIIAEVRNAAGNVVPRPWPTWFRGIDTDVLDEIAAFFFNDLRTKANASPSFKMNTKAKEMTTWICEVMKQLRTPSQQDPDPSKNSPEPTTA